MKKAIAFGFCMLLLLIGKPILAQNATEEDLYNAANQLIGEDDYICFDHTGTAVDVDGYRYKPWGTNGDLTDSGGGHGWTENNEFAEALTGLEPLITYELYVISGGKNASASSENWGVRVGLESNVYTLATIDIGDDDSITKYNLGLYENTTISRYPFREVQSSSTAACMYAVKVGTFVADENGEATVYVDNVNEVDVDGIIGSRTWYDALLVSAIYEAYDPEPADEAPQVDITTDLSWSAPRADFTYDIYLGTDEPNALADNYGPSFTKLNDEAPLTGTSIPIPFALEYATTYYWVVDSYEPGNSTPFQGTPWSFTTIPFDTTPAVTSGNSYITWLDNMPQDIDGIVDDNGEADVVDAEVLWTIETYAGDPTNNSARAFDRGMTSSNALALKELGYDPNIISDWIGCDARSDGQGNPIVLVISGLPAGSYTWTSKHHDYNDQTGLFDVYVDTVKVGTDIDMSAGEEIPTEFTTTITSDGSNPTLIIFEEDDASGDGLGIFGINSFILSDGTDTMMVDFGLESSGLASGYEAYTASDKDLESFTAQNFTLGSSTVTVSTEWGPLAAGWIDASVTKTSTDPFAPTATFNTNYPGTYIIKLTATDDDIYGPEALTDSDTLVIQVAEDACAAAQLSDNWDDFDYFDIDENCVVDVQDFAELSVKWLSNKSLTEAEAY